MPSTHIYDHPSVHPNFSRLGSVTGHWTCTMVYADCTNAISNSNAAQVGPGLTLTLAWWSMASGFQVRANDFGWIPDGPVDLSEPLCQKVTFVAATLLPSWIKTKVPESSMLRRKIQTIFISENILRLHNTP